MPKWILAIVVCVTAIVIGAIAVLVQRGGGPGGPSRQDQRVDSQSGPKATIYAESNPANQALVARDPMTGKKLLQPRAGLEGYAVPEFRLLNQDGEPVDQSVFEGKITILSFNFTNCVTACPPMTANMLQVYGELEGTPVQFCSISVDPEHDTPERLTEYAAKFGIDTDRWMFLTGAEGEAARIVNESLKFDISEDPDDAQVIPLADGTTMRNIRHPIKLFLIGPDRQILDFCSHQVVADRERFGAIARAAAE
jgi:cytochrome oxidase Cu insertion factor (SCO1/SenC/PrrC family)